MSRSGDKEDEHEASMPNRRRWFGAQQKPWSVVRRATSRLTYQARDRRDRGNESGVPRFRDPNQRPQKCPKILLPDGRRHGVGFRGIERQESASRRRPDGSNLLPSRRRCAHDRLRRRAQARNPPTCRAAMDGASRTSTFAGRYMVGLDDLVAPYQVRRVRRASTVLELGAG